MTLSITSLTFNHDSRSPGTSALSIRIDRYKEYSNPEIPNLSGKQDERYEAVAAYSLPDTLGRTVTVEAEIAGPPGVWELRATGGGVLGSISPVQIDFGSQASTKKVKLELNNRSFTQFGKSTDRWIFQYRKQNTGGWQRSLSIGITVYLLMGVPGGNWSPAASHPLNPWTTLIDKLLPHIPFSQSHEEVMQALVKLIFHGLDLKYDIQNAISSYTGLFRQTRQFYFRFQPFLDHVMDRNYDPATHFCAGTSDAYSQDLIVNCYDCACALYMFSTLLGCRAEIREQAPFGYLKTVDVIGRGKCNNPVYGCGNQDRAVMPFQARWEPDGRGFFRIHCFVVLEGKIYDATMKEWIEAPSIEDRNPLRPALRFVTDLLRRFPLFPSLPPLRPKGWLTDMTRSEYEARVIQSGTEIQPGTPKSQRIDLLREV